MPPVVPSPDQLPFFEELAPAPRPRRPHLRIQPPLLADLTARQRKAVTHDAGPLLIVAGAGTGKTTVITRRIAWLIAEKRALPSEILALTFTDRAALEMVERVDRLVPYGLHDAEISTFHAYGDRLLREHALEAGLSDRSTVLSRAEQIIFLREHLFELPLDRYRPLGDPTRFLSALVTLISRLRDEDITPAAYLDVAAATLRQRSAGSPDDAAWPRRREPARRAGGCIRRLRAPHAHDRSARLRRPGGPALACCASTRPSSRRSAAAIGTSWSTSSRTRTMPSGRSSASSPSRTAT